MVETMSKNPLNAILHIQSENYKLPLSLLIIEVNMIKFFLKRVINIKFSSKNSSKIFLCKVANYVDEMSFRKTLIL